MAQKKVYMDGTMQMVAECHPAEPLKVLYVPERGGDVIIIKCSQCYRQFFRVKLPKERE